ncbi:MAG: metal-dependent hydrolase [Negativicutes bacterium]|nr:metal-dependent hydrolase [Negativicutes bacterium]
MYRILAIMPLFPQGVPLSKRLFDLTLAVLALAAGVAGAAPVQDGGVSLIYYGHAVFALEKGDTTLIFDPYLSGNPWKVAAAEEIDTDYILVSHAHQDHLGDTVAIAKRTGAMVVTTAELARMLKEQGVAVHPMGIGGKRAFDFGYVRVTPALHGSGIPGGEACGFVVSFFGVKVYFAGDTGLFGDMALLGQLEKIDYALLPIGDNYTMGAEDAVLAVGMLKPKMVIPMHYNTNPLIKQSPEEFKQAVEKKLGIPVMVMQPGETRLISPVLSQ